MEQNDVAGSRRACYNGCARWRRTAFEKEPGMFLWRVRVVLAVVALGSAIGLSATLAGQSGASASKSDTEWRFFGGDAGATRYSSANQINAANVRNLRVAWRWSARNFGPRPANSMQVSPLIVDGVMYTTAGINRDVVALDAASGQLL